jgi:hypothetical protein
LRAFNYSWTVPVDKDWEVTNEGGIEVLRMLVARPAYNPRRPTQFALAETPPFDKVTIEADVKPLKNSVILVFTYKDPTHFNYAHLSMDTGTKQPVHNGMFHVFGGERVRISQLEGPASFPEVARWYRVRLDHDGSTGSVAVSVEGKPMPSLHAVDLSIRSGRAGIGSFFETAEFRNVRISGTSQAR